MSQPPTSQSPLSAREVPSSFADNQAYFDESRWQKFTRRLKEEPLIPLGCAVTCWALWGATRSIRSGDSYNAQRMFRMRLYGQFFTIVAMVAGSFYYNSDRILRKEYEEILKERKAIEKRNAWIKELEARDLEEKDWREKVKEVTQKRKEEEDVARAKEEAKKGDGVVTKAVKGLRGRLAGEGEGGGEGGGKP
ncbi:MAG: hypothetical protein LQ339_006728 [Xanthoria mediterranea]|nr:MAG: hypothetical protein LQ339_006728 [Xanthoria mediterranea]